MKPAAFQYHNPKTIEEAVATLAEVASEDGRVIAGGQSLVPTMAFRLARPTHLIDINGVESLHAIEVKDGKLSIGACVRHVRFETPVTEGPLGALLTAVVRNIAHYPIRTRGTFCGSVAHADPASEWCLTVATLDGEMVAKSADGERVIAAADYFQGIMTTALAEDEILVAVRLPVLPEGTKFGFYEFSRRAGDFAMGASLVTYQIKDGKIAGPCVGVGGAEPYPRRIAAAEAALTGQTPGAEAFAAAAEAAARDIEPMEDHQTNAEYRRDLVRACVRRALERAAA